MELLELVHDNLRLGNEEEAAKLHTPSTRRRTMHRRFNSDRRLQSKELSRCVEVLNSDKMLTQSTVYGLNGVSGALAWAHAARQAGVEDEPAQLPLSTADPVWENTLRLSSVT